MQRRSKFQKLLTIRHTMHTHLTLRLMQYMSQAHSMTAWLKEKSHSMKMNSVRQNSENTMLREQLRLLVVSTNFSVAASQGLSSPAFVHRQCQIIISSLVIIFSTLYVKLRIYNEGLNFQTFGKLGIVRQGRFHMASRRTSESWRSTSVLCHSQHSFQITTLHSTANQWMNIRIMFKNMLILHRLRYFLCNTILTVERHTKGLSFYCH